jgi:hypothetical protein
MAKDIRELLLKYPCSVLGYPEPWDSPAVAVIIAQRSKLDLQHARVVTWNSPLANKVLNSGTMKDDIEIMGYRYAANKLKDSSSELIVFDSMQELASLTGEVINDDGKNVEEVLGMSILPDLIKRRNIVIILFTNGVSDENFANLLKFVPGIYHFWAAFLNRFEHLQFALHESNMTAKQRIIYSGTREEEIKAEALEIEEKGFVSNPFFRSQKICNLLLPKAIQKLIGTPEEPSVEDMMAVYTKTVPKIKQEGKRSSVVIRRATSSSVRGTRGDFNYAMDSDYFFDTDEFLMDAPKIKDLMIQLSLYADMKHVIYTRYDDHSGVKMLAILLKMKGFNVFSITRDMEASARVGVLDLFNLEGNSGILIISAPIPNVEGIFNVSHLHFLDSGYDNYGVIMEEIFKYRLYKTFICNLIVHNYVCDKEGTPSADRILYDNFNFYLKSNVRALEKEKSICHNIVIGKAGNALTPMTIRGNGVRRR